MTSAPPSPHASRARRGCAALRLAVLLVPLVLLLAVAAPAFAAPATIRLLETSPSLGAPIAIAAPDGGTFSADPGRALIRVSTPDGAVLETPAWCVDARVAIVEGTDFPIDLRSAADDPRLTLPAAQEAAWLIARAEGLLALAADPGREAAAIQIAVWQLTGQAADVATVTGDAGLDARVRELRAMAAGRSAATTLALSGPSAAVALGGPAGIRVTGTPGAVVALEVSGAATPSTATVTLDGAGTAEVAVTPTGAGRIVVTGRTEGGLLWRAGRLPGSASPQDLMYVTPTTVTASTTFDVAAPAPAVTPAGAPGPGTVAAAPRPAALRLVKRAPETIARGRSIPYVLTVTNASGRVARNVVVRDPLPAGTYLPRRPLRASLAGGAVVWRLGDLAARARVTLRLRLRLLPTGGSVIRNVARASAANAATVRARAVTRVRPAVRPTTTPPVVAPVRVTPAVTG